MLLTDDGRLQARIADPKFKLPKTYLVQVEGDADPAALDRLRRGVVLKDGPARADVDRIDAPDLWRRVPPIRVRASIPDCWLKTTIREGRNRQVRRMTAAIHHPTCGWCGGASATGRWRDWRLVSGETPPRPFRHPDESQDPGSRMLRCLALGPDFRQDDGWRSGLA